MAKERKGETIFEKAADIFDLPGEVVAGLPRITMTGGRRVFIENHKGIMEYGREEIRVNGNRAVIQIEGTDLEIRSMSDSELLITGEIFCVKFIN